MSKRLFIVPEEIVPDEEFGELRRPQQIPTGYDWVAKDLETHFIVLINDKKNDLPIFDDWVEIKDIYKIDKDVIPSVLVDRIEADLDDVKKDKLKV